MAHILIPTDFSVGSLNACAYALDLYGGALNTYTLLHSYMDPLPGYAAMVDMTSVLYAASVEGLAEFSTRFRGLRNGADALVTTEVVYGPLATSLPGVCKRRNIDLIVMGTQGATVARCRKTCARASKPSPSTTPHIYSNPHPDDRTDNVCAQRKSPALSHGALPFKQSGSA